jgi:hypothetical protein
LGSGIVGAQATAELAVPIDIESDDDDDDEAQVTDDQMNLFRVIEREGTARFGFIIVDHAY